MRDGKSQLTAWSFVGGGIVSPIESPVQERIYSEVRDPGVVHPPAARASHVSTQVQR